MQAPADSRAEVPLKVSNRRSGKLSDSLYAEVIQTLFRLHAHAPQLYYRQVPEELFHLVFFQHEVPVRLFHLRAHLRQKLVRSNADRSREAELPFNPGLHL